MTADVPVTSADGPVTSPGATAPSPEATAPSPEATAPSPEATAPSPEATTPSLEATVRPSRLVLPSYGRPRGVHPPLDFSGYRSTALRHPKKPLVLLPQRLTEVTGPLLGEELITPMDGDLTMQHGGEPQGQRIILTGRVLDSDGRPVPDTLIEIWQTNAAGRYRHSREHHPAPLDPNFTGVGRAITDSGGNYRFITIQPGAYPWGNHYNAWRPAHIHFSLFGRAFTQRLVTQMYFPGDPLQPLDPIFNSVPDPKARERMIAQFDIGLTQPEWALGYRWDIVLRGRDATVFEGEDDE